MTKQELAALACRLLALWVWLIGALSLFQLWVAYWSVWINLANQESAVMWAAVWSVIAVAAIFGLGLLLWMGSERLARRMTGDPEGAAFPMRVDAGAVLSVAFAVFGMVLLAFGLAEAAKWLVRIVNLSETAMAGGVGLWARMWRVPEFAGAVVQIVLGLWLLLGSRGIVNAVLRLRGGMVKLRHGAGKLRTAGTHPRDEGEGGRGSARAEADR